MSHVLGLKFSEYGQIYYFESGAFVVAVKDRVIVKTEQGMGLGSVVTATDALPDGVEAEELKPIFRLATEEDLATEQENLTLARDAFVFCKQCVIERKLEMKLVDVEVFFDRGKMVFYFTAPGRIDFRELVKDLVKNYRTRIELRQIGVRHETQMLGAVGNCGMTACCRRFMRKFAPVTIKMAKEQNLFLNPTKISGICGRLLCCLSFEEENYREFYNQCPKIGKRMDTDKGLVKILRANFFRSTISVLPEYGEEMELTLDEWHALNPRRFDPNAPRPEPPRPAPPRGRSGAPRGKGRPRPGGPKGQDSGPAARDKGDKPAEKSGKTPDDRSADKPSSGRRKGRRSGASSRSGAGKGPSGPKKSGSKRRRPRKPKSSDS